MVILKIFSDNKHKQDNNLLLDYDIYAEDELDICGSTVKASVPRVVAEEKMAVTFLGHSTCLIRDEENYFITDPVLRERIFWLKRKNPLGKRFEDLPKIAGILISHGHYDHLDLPSLNKFPRHTPIVVPKGLDRLVAKLGFTDVRVLEWWQKTTVGSTIITAVPVKHVEGRYPFYPNSQCQGYIIKKSNSIYFAGDTGYFNGFEVIGKYFSIDIALLPIGAYHPQIRYNHLRPEEAVKAFQMLKAKHMVPIHWGTFRLSLESMQEPVNRLKLNASESGLLQQVSILQPGETISTIW